MKKNGLKLITSNSTCRHSDDFQYSMAKLTLQAKRVLILILAQISNPKEKPDDENLTFTIKASDFARICDIDKKTAYASLESAIDDLSVSFIYKDLSLGELRRTRKTAILDDLIYYSDEGFCEVSLNKKNYHYFFEMSKAFTTNNIYEVARLSDKNLFNFYQAIMKRYSKSHLNKDYKNSFIIGIDELKDEMWLFDTEKNEKTYRYAEFKFFNAFLKKLCLQASKNTSFNNISISIAEKKGRKATHLKISYQHINDIRRQEEKKLNQELNKIEDDLYKM